MNRRSFLSRIGAVAVGLTLARHLPGIAPRQLTITSPDGIYASETLQCGDMFTIDGRYAVNPLTRQPTTVLQRFVVTDDVTAGRVPDDLIYPNIRTSGPYTNAHVGHGAPSAVCIDPVLWSGPYTPSQPEVRA